MIRLVFLLLSFLGLPLFAQNEAAPPLAPDKPPAPVENYSVAFLKMILMLVGLLLIVVFMVWLIKRFGHGRIGRFKDRQTIHILEKRVLSPKTILYMVEIEGARLLVAESQLEVRPLHQWTAPTEE